MKRNNQSTRLTSQHAASQGVVGIFGEIAKRHDVNVGTIASKYLIEALEAEFPHLKFRFRKHIMKSEINRVLNDIDSELGVTYFLPTAKVIPDGGVVEVLDDHQEWRIIAVSEAKRQGKDIENIQAGIKTKGGRDIMAAGNAIERSHKNIAEFANLMLGESHFPYILFLEGSNFLTENVTVTRPDGTTITLRYDSGELNRIDRLTAANYGMPINTNHCENKVVAHKDRAITLQAASLYTQGDGEEWAPEEMLAVMLDVAKTSLKVLASDIFEQLSKPDTEGKEIDDENN